MTLRPINENCAHFLFLQNTPGSGTDWYDLITEDNLDLPNVNNLLEILQNKKQKLEAVRICES